MFGLGSQYRGIDYEIESHPRPARRFKLLQLFDSELDILIDALVGR